jgi:hypothetical protein
MGHHGVLHQSLKVQLEMSPSNESSFLKLDLFFLGLSLFLRMSSSGCEDLYLKEFFVISQSSEVGFVASDGGNSEVMISCYMSGFWRTSDIISSSESSSSEM